MCANSFGIYFSKPIDIDPTDEGFLYNENIRSIFSSAPPPNLHHNHIQKLPLQLVHPSANTVGLIRRILYDQN